jgi:phosphoribosyl 1,2-cyclic phosphodiesterase
MKIKLLHCDKDKIFCVLMVLFATCVLFSLTANANNSNTGVMTIQFLGTGAASSSEWINYSRQLSSIVVNKDLLIDFSCWTDNGSMFKGACGVARMWQFGIDMNAINYILITHHHQDHFDPEQIVALALARTSTTPMTLYGGVTVTKMMNDYLDSIVGRSLIKVVHLRPYSRVAIGPYTVTPLIATHDLPENEPYIYVIQYCGKQFLYGTDSGVLTGQSLMNIYATKFDLIIRERTFESKNNSSGHMDRDKVASERADWIKHGVITASTPYALTHIHNCSVGNCSIPIGTTDLGDRAKINISVNCCSKC